MIRQCPTCKSNNVSTERRPNGDSHCQSCGYKASTIEFDSLSNQASLALVHVSVTPSYLGKSAEYYKDKVDTYEHILLWSENVDKETIMLYLREKLSSHKENLKRALASKRDSE